MPSKLRLVEQLPCKQKVAGSMPALGSCSYGVTAAPQFLELLVLVRSQVRVHMVAIAELVKHLIVGQKITGSNPVSHTLWDLM